MSIVQTDLAGAHVLDLFAGSGALGIEALSRGARDAVFVESASHSLAALRRNLDALEVGRAATVRTGDVLRFLGRVARLQFGVAFADPPYRQGLAERVARRWLEEPFARVLGVEHEKGVALPDSHDRRVYGDTVVTFYRAP